MASKELHNTVSHPGEKLTSNILQLYIYIPVPRKVNHHNQPARNYPFSECHTSLRMAGDILATPNLWWRPVLGKVRVKGNTRMSQEDSKWLVNEL